MLVFEAPDIIRIYYEAENGLFIHEWLEYNPEDQDKEILKVLQKIYELLLEYPVRKVLVRADKTKGVFTPEMQRYIREVQFPRLVADTQLTYAATAVQEDLIQKMGAVVWEKQFDKDADVELRKFVSEQEARDWLASV